ncbi:MAG: HAMP domain-containing protein [Armatimonadetes bacterium]|nr:HAMP domain-containing protein [Armatimonadota bacterium]
MNWSFRTKLTVTNILVLTVVMTATTGALSFMLEQQLLSNIDQELQSRVNLLGAPGQPGGGRGLGGPGGQGGPRGPLNQQPQQGGPRTEAATMQTAQFQPNRPEAQSLDDLDEATRELLQIRAPRFLWKDDDPLRQRPIQNQLWNRSLAEKAILSGNTWYFYSESAQHKLRVISAPIIRNGEILGSAQIAQELDELEKVRASLWRVIGIVLPLGIVFAAFVGLVQTRRALKPISDVTSAAQKLSRQEWSEPLEVHGNDELAQLADSFNTMNENLHRSFDERDAANQNLQEALERQKRFTADASHELRTPLSRIKVLTSGALSQSGHSEEDREVLELIDQSSDGMTRLIEQLLTLARGDSGTTLSKEPCDLVEIVQSAIQSAGLNGSSRLTFSQSEPVTATVNPESLRLAIRNLLENAARYSGEDAPITVSIKENANSVTISVADAGPGIPAEHLPRITERFYRGDASRSSATGGTGLGLSIVEQAAIAHGGSLSIESEVGKGTLARLMISKRDVIH